MYTFDETPLGCAASVDALRLRGISSAGVRALVNHFPRWGDLTSASVNHRIAYGGVGARVPLPTRCPPARTMPIGRLVSYVEQGWPIALERLTNGPVICSIAGRIFNNGCGIVGASHPSGAGCRHAARCALESQERCSGVIGIADGVGAHAIRTAVEYGIAAVVVLYGDGLGGLIGGVRAHHLACDVLRSGGGVVHVVGDVWGDASLAAAMRVVAALSGELLVIDGGAGRAPGVWGVHAASELGVDIRYIDGDPTRSEWAALQSARSGLR